MYAAVAPAAACHCRHWHQATRSAPGALGPSAVPRQPGTRPPHQSSSAAPGGEGTQADLQTTWLPQRGSALASSPADSGHVVSAQHHSMHEFNTFHPVHTVQLLHHIRHEQHISRLPFRCCTPGIYKHSMRESTGSIRRAHLQHKQLSEHTGQRHICNSHCCQLHDPATHVKLMLLKTDTRCHVQL